LERLSTTTTSYPASRSSNVDRRAGDIAECWANAALAEDVIGWKAHLDLEDMMQDTWRWQSNNPDGFS